MQNLGGKFSAAHGRFHWNELLAEDVAAAKAFYTATLGWVYDEITLPSGPYFVAIKGNEPVAGITTLPANIAKSGSHWVCFVEVDNTNAAVAQAEANGGLIVQEPFDVPDVGRIAMIEDPTGALIGYVRPDFDD